MAVCIPETLPPNATAGERRVFEGLRDRFGPDVLIYYEPTIDRRRPDFIVIDPRRGVLVIEVKGWWVKNLLSGNRQRLVVLGANGEPREQLHPLEQARLYKHRLKEACENDLLHLLLVHREGPRRGQFIFPFTHVAVLAAVDRLQLAAKGPFWNEVFPPGEVWARDEFAQLCAASDDAGLDRLFDRRWDFPPLTAEQVNVLRTLIHPEIRISRRAVAPRRPVRPAIAQTMTVTEAPPWYRTGVMPRLELKVLDLEQEVAARKVGTGHRLIFGVAGSGKTVMLISRARLLASVGGKRVLVLCYNVPLAATLLAALRDEGDAVVVRHVDAAAREHGKVIRQAETNEAFGARWLAALTAPGAAFARYDAVLIDEAQDFPAVWFACARALLADPAEGDLLIVGDGNQGIYGRKGGVTWSSLGINARGRTTYFRKSYRSSKEIIEFAAPFARTEGTEDDGVSPIAIDPAQATRATSVKPVVVRSADRAEEVAKARELILTLVNQGRFGGHRLHRPLDPSEVAVIYPAVPRGGEGCLPTLRRDLEEAGVPSVWIRAAERETKTADTRQCVGEPGVKLLSVFHAKGLQFRAVIFLWADLLPQPGWLRKTREEQEALFYVALTRAEDFLAVLHSGPSEFVERLGKAGC